MPLQRLVLSAPQRTPAKHPTQTISLSICPTGTAVTGSPTATVGTEYANSIAAQGRYDASAAYGYLKQLPYDLDLTGSDLGGQTIYPGVYSFSSAAPLNGVLTLNGNGNTSSTFVFQVGMSVSLSPLCSHLM